MMMLQFGWWYTRLLQVTHSIGGQTILKNFVVGMCKAPTDWNMLDIADEFIQEVSGVSPSWDNWFAYGLLSR